MTYSHEVEHMCVVKKGPNHGPAPDRKSTRLNSSHASKSRMPSSA